MIFSAEIIAWMSDSERHSRSSLGKLDDVSGECRW